MRNLATLFAAFAIVAAAGSAQAGSSMSLSGLGVTVTNPPGKARDFLGLYNHGAANAAILDWVYVACDGKNCPNAKANPNSSKVLHLPIPRGIGQIDIRLMSLNAAGTAFDVVTEIDPDMDPH